MALDQGGRVYTWGINDYGQLGNGGTRYCTAPNQVVSLDDVEIVDITAGGWHSAAVSKAGTDLPVCHGCDILPSSGELYTWGRGEYGRLGLGDKSGSTRLRPHKVPGLEEHQVVNASAGGTHTMCLTSEGLMFIWGRGSYGRLGDRDSARDRCAWHLLQSDSLMLQICAQTG